MYSSSSLSILILIVAHELKLLRKYENLFVILSRNKILHFYFLVIPQNWIKILRVNYKSDIESLYVWFYFMDYDIIFFKNKRKTQGSLY